MNFVFDGFVEFDIPASIKKDPFAGISGMGFAPSTETPEEAFARFVSYVKYYKLKGFRVTLAQMSRKCRKCGGTCKVLDPKDATYKICDQCNESTASIVVFRYSDDDVFEVPARCLMCEGQGWVIDYAKCAEDDEGRLYTMPCQMFQEEVLG